MVRYNSMWASKCRHKQCVMKLLLTFSKIKVVINETFTSPTLVVQQTFCVPHLKRYIRRWNCD